MGFKAAILGLALLAMLLVMAPPAFGWTMTAREHFLSARTYLQNSQFDEAIESINQAIAVFNPATEEELTEAALYDTRGLAIFGKQIYAEALKDFNRAIALAPNFAPPYLHRARVYSETGRIRAAYLGYHEFLNRAGNDGNDPDIAEVRRVMTIGARMITAIEEDDRAVIKLYVTIEEALPNQTTDSCVWEKGDGYISFRHVLNDARGAKLEVRVDSVKKHADYTLIILKEIHQDSRTDESGSYSIKAAFGALDPDVYRVQLLGITEYGQVPYQNERLISETEFKME